MGYSNKSAVKNMAVKNMNAPSCRITSSPFLTWLAFTAMLGFMIAMPMHYATAQSCGDSNVLCNTRDDVPNGAKGQDPDIPAAYSKKTNGDYDFRNKGEKTVLVLDFAPSGTVVDNLEVRIDPQGRLTRDVTGASAVVARRGVRCENGTWTRLNVSPTNNSCTEVLAPSNCNRCGYCENDANNQPALGIAEILFPADLSNNPFLPGRILDPRANPPVVNYEQGRVQESDLPEYCNLSYEELVAQGYISPKKPVSDENQGGTSIDSGNANVVGTDPTGSQFLKECRLQSLIPQGQYEAGEYTAIPERLVSLTPNDRGADAKVIAYPFCANDVLSDPKYRYIRVDFVGDNPAGVSSTVRGGNDALERIIIPSRCDTSIDPISGQAVNDYKIFVDSHEGIKNDIDVDIMCPPAVFQLCPSAADVASGSITGVNVPTNGLISIPNDPVCGSNGLFQDYITGSGNNAQFCECGCNGSANPAAGGRQSCTSACGSEAGRTDRVTIADMNMGNLCGPNSAIVAGSFGVDASGQVSWLCRWQDPTDNQPNPFPITSGPRSFDNRATLQHQCTARVQTVASASCRVSPAQIVRTRATKEATTCTNDTSRTDSTNYTRIATTAGFGTQNFNPVNGCGFNNDGVTTELRLSYDERSCQVDVDNWNCTGSGCQANNNTVRCQCSSSTVYEPLSGRTTAQECASRCTFGAFKIGNSSPAPGLCGSDGTLRCSCFAQQQGPFTEPEERLETFGGVCGPVTKIAEPCNNTLVSSSSFTSGSSCAAIDQNPPACDVSRHNVTSSYVDAISDGFRVTTSEGPASQRRCATFAATGNGGNKNCNSISNGGNCPGATNPPSSCSSTSSSGTFTQTTFEPQCSREIERYTCQCTEACGPAAGGIFTDTSFANDPAVLCEGSANSYDNNISVNNGVASWSCTTAGGFSSVSCQAVIDNPTPSFTQAQLDAFCANENNDNKLSGVCGETELDRSFRQEYNGVYYCGRLVGVQIPTRPGCIGANYYGFSAFQIIADPSGNPARGQTIYSQNNACRDLNCVINDVVR